MEKIGFFLRGFGFATHEGGGIDVVVRATDSPHSPIIRRLHMSEEELYEMLALLGISAETVDEGETLDELADFAEAEEA
jgi:hypothetical protein